MALGEHPQGDVLDLHRQRQPIGHAGHAFRHLPEGRGAWVVRAVHTMTEAHQPLATVERVLDPRLGPLWRADLVQLADHF